MWTNNDYNIINTSERYVINLPFKENHYYMFVRRMKGFGCNILRPIKLFLTNWRISTAHSLYFDYELRCKNGIVRRPLVMLARWS